MEIAYSLPKQIDSGPYVLTMGNFDGVHIGHKALLGHLNETALRIHAKKVILTYSNHPSTVLSPDCPTPLLCSLRHKIQLLEQEGIDLLIVLPFTAEFSSQPPELFLKQLREAVPFAYLVLGRDATFGKNKIGSKEIVQRISSRLGFESEYLADITLNSKRVSSSHIRFLVKSGQLQEAEKHLGRPFSIYGTVSTGYGRGLQIGFPTANISVEGLCLPPLGVYAVIIKHGLQTYRGVANLGIAPTMRNDQKPLFEVHIFDHSSDLYGQNVEVIFNGYIRPERRFESVEQLKQQIANDIKDAKLIFC